MKFFLYSHHCCDLVAFDSFDTTEALAEKIIQIRKCCQDAGIVVVRGERLKVEDVEVVTKVTFKDQHDRNVQ